MQHVAFEKPSFAVMLNEKLDIVKAWGVRAGYRHPPCVIQSPGLLSSAHCKPEWREDGFFATDGLGCIRLCYCGSLASIRTPAMEPILLRRFYDMFYDNPVDAFTAVQRIMLGLEHYAAGETSYFISRQWRHHPDEMTALAVLSELARAAG